MTPLLAVPNVSEGRDGGRIEEIGEAFSRGLSLLDRHTDADHGRTVFTLAGSRGQMFESLLAGATAAIDLIDLSDHSGAHPRIGALDVCPVVWVAEDQEHEARTTAVAVAEQIGALGVPVFLYGSLARTPAREERSYFRSGGPLELARRMETGQVAADFGPGMPHPTAGATLVTARSPLAAFNLELDTAESSVARDVARRLRESGGGLDGVRAIGLGLASGRAQVSTNVHDPFAVPLRAVVDRVRELAAEHGARPVEAELVGLIPEAALEDYPQDVPIRGFDPNQHVIERRLAAL
jgi:glutamate formiminotransferase / 5-formyltetrahydrofolate cyclo-ligase